MMIFLFECDGLVRCNFHKCLLKSLSDKKILFFIGSREACVGQSRDVEKGEIPRSSSKASVTKVSSVIFFLF